MRRILALGCSALLAACAVGPGYNRPEMEQPQAWRAPGTAYDSTRPFFDSLRAVVDSTARVTGDTSMLSRPYVEPPSLPDSAATLAWFELLKDSTLHRLITIALQENKDVRVAVASIAEYRALHGIAKSELYPQLFANGLVGTNKTFVPVFGTNSGFDVWKATADVQWELDFFGRIRRSSQAANADYLSRQESQRAVILSLVSDVATAYLELRELDQNLEIARRTLNSRKESLRLAEQRFREGLTSELDVRQFESEVATPAAQVANFERQVTQKENQLSVLLGHNPAAVPRGRPLSETLSLITIPAGVPASLLERRPDVRQAEQQLAGATARIGVAVGQRWPRIMLTGQYGTQSETFDQMFGSNNEIYQLFGGISIPLFTFGRVSKQVDVARAQAEQARYQYEKTVIAAVQEAENALAAVRTARDVVVATSQQVNALRRAVRLVNLRYTDGVSNYLEVLDAERGLFSAELGLTQSQRFQLVSAVQLYKALGGGWPVSPEDSVSVPATKLPGQ
jgi:outer membrane protein, multidrug efflux system